MTPLQTIKRYQASEPLCGIPMTVYMELREMANECGRPDFKVNLKKLCLMTGLQQWLVLTCMLELDRIDVILIKRRKNGRRYPPYIVLQNWKPRRKKKECAV